jgi:hypothetical protein
MIDIEKTKATDVVIDENKRQAQQKISLLQEYADELNSRIEKYNSQPILKAITSKKDAITYIENPKDFLDDAIKTELEYKEGMILSKVAELYGISYAEIVNQQSKIYYDEYDSYNFLDGTFQVKESAIDEIYKNSVRYAVSDEQAQTLQYMEQFKDELQKVCDYFSVQNTDRNHLFRDLGINAIDGKLHLNKPYIASKQQLKNKSII